MTRRGDSDRAPPFRSSREAYDWILWDPGFTPSEYVIGYDDHADAAGEMALESFDPGGEIPWHRVWYIRRGEDVVWDREQRIDRLATVRRDPLAPLPPRERRVPARAASSGPSFICPHCAETTDTWPDPGGGPRQTYVEDCAVCCRPNRIDVWSDEDGAYVAHASPDE